MNEMRRIRRSDGAGAGGHEAPGRRVNTARSRRALPSAGGQTPGGQGPQ